MCGLTPNHINYFNIGGSFKIDFMIFSRAKLEIFAEEFMRLRDVEHFGFSYCLSMLVLQAGSIGCNYDLVEALAARLEDLYEKKEIESKDFKKDV